LANSVLSIAGSDCSGGAGIQADLKMFSAWGVFGMSAIVSVVAENTSRVIDLQDISPEMIGKQIDAVFEDIEVDAVKIGMLSSAECMEAVAEKIRQYKPSHVVIDPVMYAKNGCPLMEMAAIDTLVKEIIPLADVLTPNIPEAEKIAGMSIQTAVEMEAAARKIHNLGCGAVVVGAMFPTRTKSDARLVTFRELRAIRQAVSVPIVVIGGINRENAALFPGMGIDGLAVISAILAKPDIRLAAAGLKAVFNQALSSNFLE